jgi:hypothetical protein
MAARYHFRSRAVIRKKALAEAAMQAAAQTSAAV